jgi:hypothetical protein
MSTVTPTTQLNLISKLTPATTLTTGDIHVIQRGLKTYKIGNDDFLTSLADGSTLEKSGDSLAIKDGGVTKAKIEDTSSNAVLGNLSGGGSIQEVEVKDSIDATSSVAIVTENGIVEYVETQLSNVSPFSNYCFYVNDGNYQDLTSGWNRSNLSPFLEAIDGASLSSNVITLPAGTYMIRAQMNIEVPNTNHGTVRANSAIVVDATNSVLVHGSQYHSFDDATITTSSDALGFVQLVEETDISYKLYTTSGSMNIGASSAGGGVANRNAYVEIWKVS